MWGIGLTIWQIVIGIMVLTSIVTKDIQVALGAVAMSIQWAAIVMRPR